MIVYYKTEYIMHKTTVSTNLDRSIYGRDVQNCHSGYNVDSGCEICIYSYNKKRSKSVTSFKY